MLTCELFCNLCPIISCWADMLVSLGPSTQVGRPDCWDRSGITLSWPRRRAGSCVTHLHLVYTGPPEAQAPPHIPPPRRRCPSSHAPLQPTLTPLQLCSCHDALLLSIPVPTKAPELPPKQAGSPSICRLQLAALLLVSQERRNADGSRRCRPTLAVMLGRRNHSGWSRCDARLLEPWFRSAPNKACLCLYPEVSAAIACVGEREPETYHLALPESQRL